MRKIILIIVILLFAAGVGYYIYRDVVQHRVLDTEPTTVVGSVENKQSEQAQQIEQLQQQPKVPNLDRPLNITANLPEDAQKIAKDKIEKLTLELKQNPALVEDWLVLGIYRKMIGDYEGAKECWEYAAAIDPQSPTPFNNLGDLYANYLKDSKKAEENFLIAIKNNPNQIYIYRSTYELYRYVLKDDAKARAILEQGIKANPTTSQDLQNLLNNF
jgi:tetratricopeptide (TPR) repeat protein